MHPRVSGTGRVNQDSRKVGTIAGPIGKSPAASTDGAGDPALASPLSADPLRQFMTEIFLAGFSASLREFSSSRSEFVRSNRLPSGGNISTNIVKSVRRAFLLSATLAASIPVLSAPANAQGLLSRIGRTLERIEQKTAEIENKAATLERSVTQVKQAADGIDRTVDTVGALLGGDQEGGD